ncbi:protein CutA homolog [Xenopus laevis]|uniref:Protein CutA homolog n=1 Tax=Xenopus laevis TaxID=8355 RepID=A0A8J1LM68_XENLA|nr:protein CutA homolog [Xenopus laevis]
MASDSYVSGSLSAAYVTCPNDTVAKDIGQYVSDWLIYNKITFLFTNFLLSVHSYEVCEVLSLPIEQGNPPYLKWVGDIVPK